MAVSLTSGLSLGATPLYPGFVAAGTADTGGLALGSGRGDNYSGLIARCMFLISIGNPASGAAVSFQLQEAKDNAVFINLNSGKSNIFEYNQSSGKIATMEIRPDQLTVLSGYWYVRCRALVSGGASVVHSVLPFSSVTINSTGSVLTASGSLLLQQFVYPD